MTYAEKVAEISKEILKEAEHLVSLERERRRWMVPEGATFNIGGTHYWAVRKDGTTTPGLEAIQRQAIAIHDDLIFKSKSRIEGLRFKLVQVAKAGPASVEGNA